MFDNDNMLPFEKAYNDARTFAIKLISNINIAFAPSSMDMDDKNNVFLYDKLLVTHCDMDEDQYEWCQ
jgi:hypothetical protein